MDRSGKLTLGEYLNQWLDTYCELRLAKNTVLGYRVNVDKHIIPYIGEIQLDKLQPTDVERLYTVLLGNGLSNTSVRYVHAVLRCALNCALRRRMVSENAANLAYAPRRVKYHPTVLDESQLLRLLAVCEGTKLYIPVLLAVTLGMRRGEVLGLRWCDIELDRSLLHVRRSASFYAGQGMEYGDTKSESSYRTLLLSPHVVAALDALPRSDPQGLVVPLTPNALTTGYHRALKRAGLPRIRFHDLRHSNATLMLRKSVAPKIVSSMLGHSGIGITLDLYSHVLTDMQAPAVAVINDLLGIGKDLLQV